MKTIVIYCSKTGNTDKVAHSILYGLNGQADVVRLELTQGGLLKNFNPHFTFDFANYDTVFIGGWVMMMRVHPFVAAYINSCEGLEGKNIVGFMTGAAIFSKGHVRDDFKHLVEKKGGTFSDDNFLYTTTLLGPLLTEEKLQRAEKFAQKILENFNNGNKGE